MTRERPPERVEMITGDPRAFGAAAPASSPLPSELPTPLSRRRAWLVVGVVVAIALAVALVWPRPSPAALTPVTTTVPGVTGPTSTITGLVTAEPPPTTSPGRPAPAPTDGAHIGVSIAPSTAVIFRSVTVRLSGDLVSVSPTVAAVVWIDQQSSGIWRTVAWIAHLGDGSQVFTPVADGSPTPAPDAIFLPPDQPFDLTMDRLRTGSYRLCRYVPIRAADAVTLPTDNPIYVCAPLVVDNDLHPSAATTPTT